MQLPRLWLFMQIYTQSDANAKGAIMSHLKNNSKYTKLILHPKSFSKLKYAGEKMLQLFHFNFNYHEYDRLCSLQHILERSGVHHEFLKLKNIILEVFF